jgi:hypothetical protein
MHFTGQTLEQIEQPLQWSKSIPTTSGLPFCLSDDLTIFTALSGQYRKHIMQWMHLLNSMLGRIFLQLPVLNSMLLPPSALAPMLISFLFLSAILYFV